MAKNFLMAPRCGDMFDLLFQTACRMTNMQVCSARDKKMIEPLPIL